MTLGHVMGREPADVLMFLVEFQAHLGGEREAAVVGLREEVGE